jgi:hypothetical protein
MRSNNALFTWCGTGSDSTVLASPVTTSWQSSTNSRKCSNMPDGRTHGRIGAVAGATATLLATADLPNDARVFATLGGVLAGYAGGKAPDLLEPAIHSWHRSECHSVAAGTAVIALAVEAEELLRTTLLGQAAELRAMRLALPEDHSDRLSLWLREIAVYMAYGATIGLAAGYTSHLLLDGGTDLGIPLLSQGLT